MKKLSIYLTIVFAIIVSFKNGEKVVFDNEGYKASYEGSSVYIKDEKGNSIFIANNDAVNYVQVI